MIHLFSIQIINDRCNQQNFVFEFMNISNKKFQIDSTFIDQYTDSTY